MRRPKAREVGAALRLARLQIRHSALRGQLFYIARGPDVRLMPGATVEIARGVCIMPDATLSVAGSLSIGPRTFINRGVYLSCKEQVSIGADCLFGERVSVHDENHAWRGRDRPVLQQGFTTAPVTIGRNVWLGAGVVVLAGVTIGDDCVVGAGSVVTKSVPPGSVSVGIPARVIAHRDMHAAATVTGSELG